MDNQSKAVLYQVIILGAGPAGISAAVEAIKRGIKSNEILILEKFGEVAHTIVSKYPNEKAVLANYKNKVADPSTGLYINDMTKQQFMSFMDETVEKYELKIEFYQTAEKITKLKNGQIQVKTSNDSFLGSSLFVAIGTMSAPRTLGVSTSESISEKIYFDIQAITPAAKRVLIVGGVDSAAEYASILTERGHKVSLSYRGASFEKMLDSNNEATMKLIEKGKIEFFASTNIQSIEENNLNPVVHFKEMANGHEFDAVVTALGTERPANYLSSLGIKIINEDDEIFAESSLEGVFYVGDLATRRGGSINIAFNSGIKAVAQACTNYLDCKSLK